MAEDTLTGEPTDDTGTTDTGSQVSDDGQSTAASDAGTTDDGPQNQAQDVIYDPATYKTLTGALNEAGQGELAGQVDAFVKSLQGNYTQKTQAIADARQKIEAYDALNRDPHGQLQSLAQRYGYQLTPANGGKDDAKTDFEPQSWDDVMSAATERAKSAILQDLAPALQELQNMRKSSIEQQLSSIDPGWKTYEDNMMQMLNTHPTLANDPATLYRMSVPSDVLESRATQAALRRLENKTKSSNVAGGSSTTKTPAQPEQASSFNEAVKIAQRKLADEGLRPPGRV